MLGSTSPNTHFLNLVDELAKSYKPGSETHLAPRSFKLIKIPCAAIHRHIATKRKAWQGGEIAGVAVCNTRLTYAVSNNVKTFPQLLICAITHTDAAEEQA